MGCAGADFLELTWSLDCSVAVVRNERSRYKPKSRPQARVTEPNRMVAASGSRGRAMVRSS